MNNQYFNYLKSKEVFEIPFYFYGFENTIFKYGYLHNGFKLINPEKLDYSIIKIIESDLDYSNIDYIYLEALIIYYYNKGSLKLDKKFKLFLNKYTNNPYMLLRYSRYLSSSLYKYNNKNQKYLILGIEKARKAINILEDIHSENEIPTFIYSWLGYIYLELGKYEKAISLFNNSINLNIKYHNHYQAEPYLWKAIALNKIGNFTKSQKIYYFIIDKTNSNLINNKLDFRVYKMISNNYYNLGDYKSFYKNLKITIKKFLEVNSFNFLFDNIKLKLGFKKDMFIFESIIEKNSYISFFKYNKKYIYGTEDNIIFSISYLYKERLLGRKVIFNDSRGIEILCYNYLLLIYEGKIR